MTETPAGPAPQASNGDQLGLSVTVHTADTARADHPTTVPEQVVEVNGEVDLASAWLLARSLARVQNQGPAGPDPTHRVVVDVADMTFCGAAGLGLLARAADHASGTGTVWALAGLSPQLTQLLLAHWPGAGVCQKVGVTGLIGSVNCGW